VLDAMVKTGAHPAPSYRGSMLLEAGKVDEAIAEFRKGQAALDLEGVLAREGLGIALETKALAETDPGARQKLLEESLATFTAMQPDPTGPRRAYALYHQGRIEMTLGKRAEAKASFEKAKELGASTDLPELIERRLATL
jgi:tetratricopeptide (TPR) repeat protein